MTARIVIFLTDAALRQGLAAGLAEAGHAVEAFEDSVVAWDALSKAKSIKFLITRVGAPAGMVPGISLARHLRSVHPRTGIIFIASTPENAELADGMGEVFIAPVSRAAILAAVDRALAMPAEPPAAPDKPGMSA